MCTNIIGKISLFKMILNNHHFVFNVESFPCPHVDILSSLVVLYHTLCACYNWNQHMTETGGKTG